MTAPFKEWTVLPHGKLTRINERIVTVVGELKMPLMKLPRRMTVVVVGDRAVIERPLRALGMPVEVLPEAEA